ncbi:MAG: hypothetical protein R3B13_20035 [Polyangiaceae bacterium]
MFADTSGGGGGSGGSGNTEGTGAATCTLWQHETKLQAADSASSSELGFSISLSGERALIGAWEDGASAIAAGAAYVFERSASGSWVERAKLVADDATSYVRFGVSVSLDGDSALVGAFEDDTVATSAGAAYVFARDASGAWSQRQKLTASDGAEVDELGVAVSIRGDTALVGTRGKDDLGTDAGAAYVFERKAGIGYVQVKKLWASDASPYAWFGAAVDMQADYALVGAWKHGNTGGKAYLFRRPDFAEVAQLVATDSEPDDRFGRSLSLGNDRALIGAPGHSEQGQASGTAYVFERQSSGAWLQVAKLVPEDAHKGDLFGSAVSLMGDRALVAAVSDEDHGEGTGSAYLFERTPAGEWKQIQKLVASDGAFADNFGAAVGLSPVVALVGAPGVDDRGEGSGAAYLYECN